MFEILYRITDKRDYLESLGEKSFDLGGDVLGFFALNVNGYHFGHYHNYPLKPDECDWEKITNWLLLLTYVYKELNHSGYALLDIVDSFNTWLEFKKNKDEVVINIIKAEKEEGDYSEIRLIPLDKFEYGDWYIQSVKLGKVHEELVKRQNEAIRLNDFRLELSRKALQYLDEINEINPKLLKNENFEKLKKRLPYLMKK